MPLSFSHSNSGLEIICLQPLVLYICSVKECNVFVPICKTHKTLHTLLMTLIWGSVSVLKPQNHNPALPGSVRTPNLPRYCGESQSLNASVECAAHFICLKGTDNWNVKHILLQRTRSGIISCVFVWWMFFSCCSSAQDSACEVQRLNMWPCWRSRKGEREGRRGRGGEGRAAAFQLQHGCAFLWNMHRSRDPQTHQTTCHCILEMSDTTEN